MRRQKKKKKKALGMADKGDGALLRHSRGGVAATVLSARYSRVEGRRGRSGWGEGGARGRERLVGSAGGAGIWFEWKG